MYQVYDVANIAAALQHYQNQQTALLFPGDAWLAPAIAQPVPPPPPWEPPHGGSATEGQAFPPGTDFHDPDPDTLQPPPLPEEALPVVTVSAPREQLVTPAPFTGVDPGQMYQGPAFLAGVAPAPSPKPGRRAPVRRTKPPPPSRRRRPSSPPQRGPRGPRIDVPGIVGKGLLRRFLGLLGLVPAYMHVAGKVDSYGTREWFERIYGFPFPDADNGRERPRESTRPSPVAGSGRDPLVAFPSSEGPLATVPVIGTRPRPLPVDAPFLFPVELPGLGANPLESFRSPNPHQKPEPVNAPVQVPISPTLPELFPFAPPAPAPHPRPRPEPRPNPSPFAPPIPDVAIAPQPFAPALADPCDCGGKGGKKKKPKKDRTVCWKGTFVEKSKGLSKTRRERVSCKTGKPLQE